MSTTFIIKAEPESHSVWMPSSGAFDDILELIIDHLYKSEESLSLGEHLKSIIIPSFYGNISKLDEEQFNLLRDMADELFWEALISEQVIDLRAFSQLKSLFRLDSRNRSIDQSRQETAIYFNADLIWTSPLWMVDLIAEMSLIELRRAEITPSLSKLLLGWCSHQIPYNLSHVTVEDYCHLLTIMDWLTQYFDHPQKGKIAFSNEFSATTYNKTREMLEIANRDVRSHNCK